MRWPNLKDFKQSCHSRKDQFQDKWRMKSGGPVRPRFYSRPKIHKPDIQLRPNVALQGAPTNNLSREISRIWKHIADWFNNSIKSPIQFLDRIKNIQISNDELMIFFDSTVLFTSIEPISAKETLSLLFNNDTNFPKYTRLQCQSLLEVIDLCSTTHFQFNEKIYKQTKEAPIESIILGLIE